MTLNGDADRLRHEWAALKAALWSYRWDWGPKLVLIYLGGLACTLLARLVQL